MKCRTLYSLLEKELSRVSIIKNINAEFNIIGLFTEQLKHVPAVLYTYTIKKI